MAKGVSVSVAADTRVFQQGIKSGVLEPLQSTADTLKKITDAGDTAGADLEQTFTQQQRSTQQLKGDIESLNQTIRQGSSSANRSMRQESQQTTRAVSEGYTEMKDSAKQNSIQTAASFNGSFDSLSGGIQGMVSEFAAGFGPAGLVAGIVAGGGLGLLTTAIDGATQATQADQQAVADLAKQWIDAGTKGKRALGDVKSAIEDMATNTDGSAIITLQTAWGEAGRAGADYKDVVESIATADAHQIQGALDKVQALKQQADLTGKLGTQTVDLNAKSAIGNVVQQAAVMNLEAALKKALAQSKDATKAQELAAEAGISKWGEKVAVIGQLHDAYASAAGEATKYENKEHTILDTKKYIKSMEERQHALEQYQHTLSKSSLSAAAKSYIESLGESDAAAYMAGYQKATPKQRAQLDAIWTTAAKTNASSYGDALGTNIKNIKAPAPHIARPVVPAPDSSRLDAFLRQPRTAKIIVEAYTRNGQRVL